MANALDGNVFVITGASSGIGAATAIEAGKAKMKVVLAARRPQQLDAVAASVREVGGEALVVPTDVADADEIDRLFDQSVERFGRIDAVFANAGYGYFAHSERDGDYEQHMWDVNYHGVVRCMRRAVERFREQGGGGHILACSSLVAKTGLPYYGTYTATKAAIHGMVTSMQLELKPEGIHVAVVYPGSTDTEFHQRIERRCGRDAASENTPKWLMQPPDAVARQVIACLRRPRPEVWPTRLGWLFAGLWSLSPRFRAFCFGKHEETARKMFDNGVKRKGAEKGEGEVEAV